MVGKPRTNDVLLGGPKPKTHGSKKLSRAYQVAVGSHNVTATPPASWLSLSSVETASIDAHLDSLT